MELQLFLFLQYLWDLERPMMVSSTAAVCPASYSNNMQGQMSKLTACSQEQQHSINCL